MRNEFRRMIDEFLFHTFDAESYAVSVEDDGFFNYVRCRGGFDIPGWGTGHVDEKGDVIIDS